MSRDPQINVRLPADLKDAVQKMAEDNKRSVNAEVVAVLLEAVKRHNLGESIAGVKDIYLPSEIIDEIARRTALELKK
ncbi:MULTISPECIES: Arc family DNA-binding protein [Klebsiella]|uniref:Arc family DNA-binding protein n=1 Tax=Klebsiella TaxID=570 RepID=UPI000DF1E4A5|nr:MULTISPECIES: Arc family DNA-binding protein [Klebsiella]HDU2983019.1 Arc family DNA-binding protein [Klebsiella pneumoniae subsp. pneumoniae]ELD4483635.1 Arc family DNA-binding protein [Klebsiella oxytoca]ELV3644073.1 Arc family DNA-binding protein [Klebsiella oxytoca]MBZ7566787.1 Arc family DNA-binding protein [Klebsiella grimontii]MDU2495735.1 Arc family DNA-binding protein [Klebsiella grimontii]